MPEHLPREITRTISEARRPGAYACWLAARGYRVHLVDALAFHVEQAREASALQPCAPARRARRRGRHGAAPGPALSRDRQDPTHRSPEGSAAGTRAGRASLRSRRRPLRLAPVRHGRRAARRPRGACHRRARGVEGPGWLLQDLDMRWANPGERERLLQAARAVEREPTLLGLHAHLLAVARRPASEAG